MLRTIRRYFALRALTKASNAYDDAVSDFTVSLPVAMARAALARTDMNRALATLRGL
jgi:hypothetical protein